MRPYRADGLPYIEHSYIISESVMAQRLPFWVVMGIQITPPSAPASTVKVSCSGPVNWYVCFAAASHDTDSPTLTMMLPWPVNTMPFTVTASTPSSTVHQMVHGASFWLSVVSGPSPTVYIAASSGEEGISGSSAQEAKPAERTRTEAKRTIDLRLRNCLNLI